MNAPSKPSSSSGPYHFKHAHGKPDYSIEGPWIIGGPGLSGACSWKNRTEAALIVRYLNTAYVEGRTLGQMEGASISNG